MTRCKVIIIYHYISRQSKHKCHLPCSRRSKQANITLTEFCFKKTHSHLALLYVTPSLAPSTELIWLCIACRVRSKVSGMTQQDTNQITIASFISHLHGSAIYNILNHLQCHKYTIHLPNNMTLNMLFPATRNNLCSVVTSYVSTCNISLVFSIQLLPEDSKCLPPLCVCAYS